MVGIVVPFTGTQPFISQPLNIPVAEAARRMGVSKSKAYQMALSGDLPHLKIGRRVLIPVAALERWIEQGTVGASGGSN